MDNVTIHITQCAFQSVDFVISEKNERTQFFEYSLTPEPDALFVDGMMRKSEKTKLRKHLLSLEISVENPHADVCVIDGGDLLYQTS